MRKFILFTLFAGLSSLSIFSQPNLAVSRFLTNRILKSAGVSIAIMDAESGKLAASYNPYLNLTTASTLKLITTATALEVFGADYRFETKVFLSGKGSGETWNGDIYLRGSGDPTIGSQYSLQTRTAFFDLIYSSLVKKGVREIQGDIVGDESAYNTEIIPAKTPWEDMGNYYAAGISALNYGDNMYKLTMKTGAAGTTPEIVGVDPAIKGLTFKNYLVARANDKDSAFLYGMPYGYERSIYGSAPARRASFTIKGDVPDPALFMVEELTIYLKSKGVIIRGKSTTSRLMTMQKEPMKSELQLLCAYRSDPLSHIVKITNKHSYNFYAEALMRLIASKADSEASLSAGIAYLKHYWAIRRLDTGFLMYDGSGLSPANRVNAQFFVDLISFMDSKSRYADAFTSSLAIAGVDGTLRSFSVNGGANTRVRAKSGSFDGVLSYSGIIEQKHHKYYFCVIVNAFTSPSSEVKKAIEKLLTDL